MTKTFIFNGRNAEKKLETVTEGTDCHLLDIVQITFRVYDHYIGRKKYSKTADMI